MDASTRSMDSPTRSELTPRTRASQKNPHEFKPESVKASLISDPRRRVAKGFRIHPKNGFVRH
jgi:hypothetical protein